MRNPSPTLQGEGLLQGKSWQEYLIFREVEQIPQKVPLFRMADDELFYLRDVRQIGEPIGELYHDKPCGEEILNLYDGVASCVNR